MDGVRQLDHFLLELSHAEVAMSMYRVFYAVDSPVQIYGRWTRRLQILANTFDLKPKCGEPLFRQVLDPKVKTIGRSNADSRCSSYPKLANGLPNATDIA